MFKSVEELTDIAKMWVKCHELGEYSHLFLS